MLGHTGVFLTILALGMGGFSLTHTLHLFKRTGLRFLRLHNWIFILFNYMVFVGLGFNYFQFNLGAHLSSGLERKIFQAYHFQLSLVSFLLLYIFFLMIHELLQEEWSVRWKIVFFVVFGFLITSQAIFSLLNLSTGKIPIYVLFLLVTFFSVQLIILVTGISLFLRASSFEHPSNQKSLKKFALLIIIIFIPDITFNFFQLFNMVSLHLYVFLKSLQTLIINLLPFMFMKGFIQKMFPEHTLIGLTGAPLKHLFEKYKITRREKEIIQLICQGKSNREIEDELFISLQTVKDHVYNIFQKTGVKNRVQLTNLFRGSGE